MNFSDSKLLYRKLKSFFPELELEENQIKTAAGKILQLYPVEFGSNLKRIRSGKGISQIPLAGYLGVAQTTYSSWETGAHSPRISNLAMLSQYLQVDVGEFFPLSKNQTGKTLPLFIQSDFCSINADHFSNYVLKHAGQHTRDYFDSEYSFAFYNDDESMIGPVESIPLKSTVFCSLVKDVNVGDPFKKLYSLCGKVVLLSIVKGPALLREIIFDGKYIRFKAWNPKVEDIICLSSEQQSLPEGNEDLAMFANHPLCASMIEVFGIAHKILKDVK